MVEWDHEQCLQWMFEAKLEDIAALFLDSNLNGRKLVHMATPLRGRSYLAQLAQLEGEELDAVSSRLQSAFRGAYLPQSPEESAVNLLIAPENLLEPREYNLEYASDSTSSNF